MVTEKSEYPTIRQETIQINGKFRIVFEKAASANKIDGFKVEVNGDNLDQAKIDAEKLYEYALSQVEKNKPVPTPSSGKTEVKA